MIDGLDDLGATVSIIGDPRTRRRPQALDGLGFSIPNPITAIKQKAQASAWDLFVLMLKRRLGL